MVGVDCAIGASGFRVDEARSLRQLHIRFNYYGFIVDCSPSQVSLAMRVGNSSFSNTCLLPYPNSAALSLYLYHINLRLLLASDHFTLSYHGFFRERLESQDLWWKFYQ